MTAVDWTLTSVIVVFIVVVARELLRLRDRVTRLEARINGWDADHERLHRRH